MKCYVQDVRIQGCPGQGLGKQLCLSGTGDNVEPVAHQSWTPTWNCFLLLVAGTPGVSRMVVRSRGTMKVLSIPSQMSAFVLGKWLIQ